MRVRSALLLLLLPLLVLVTAVMPLAAQSALTAPSVVPTPDPHFGVAWPSAAIVRTRPSGHDVAGAFAMTAARSHPSRAWPAARQARRTPSWVKWGLVGAGAGAVTFALLGQATIGEPNPVLQDAALGAVAGFAIVGGSVALWGAVCGDDSGSRRAGLCGR